MSLTPSYPRSVAIMLFALNSREVHYCYVAFYYLFLVVFNYNNTSSIYKARKQFASRDSQNKFSNAIVSSPAVSFGCSLLSFFLVSQKKKTLTRTRCVQTVATVVFMEMNRGSLNPLFVCRLPPPVVFHLFPLSPPGSSPPRARAPTFSTSLPRVLGTSLASAPLSFCPLYSPPSLSCSSLSHSLLSPNNRLLPCPARAEAKSTRAAAAAVCPPNYAEFISYGAQHACRRHPTLLFALLLFPL